MHTGRIVIFFSLVLAIIFLELYIHIFSSAHLPIYLWMALSLPAGLLGFFFGRTGLIAFFVFALGLNILASYHPSPNNSLESVVLWANTFVVFVFYLIREKIKENQLKKDLILATTTNAVIMTDNTGKVTVFNKKAEEFYGLTEIEATGCYWRDIMGPDNWDKNSQHPTLVDKTLATGLPQFEVERPFKNGDRWFLVDSLPVREGQKLAGVLLIIRDITERKNIEKELEDKNRELQRMVDRDGLTGVYNHSFFQKCLQRDLVMAGQNGNNLALLFMDVNYFKYYNDFYGHQEGDLILATVAGLISNAVKDKGIVARYGGDEFAAVIPHADGDEASLLAQKIKETVENFRFRGEENLPGEAISLSIGIALYPEHGKTREELLKTADEALYKAKKESKERVELYFSVFSNLKNELATSEMELVQTLKTLISIVNAKDLYTFGHSERVLEYSIKIAQNMGLEAEQIRLLKLGAFIHDIGKIEIGSEILNKPGALDEWEWETIKKHPVLGANIVKPIRSLWKVTPIIKYHHEWFNGQGYPSGLSGRQIPLLARIVSVADCFDALTSNRPYRQRLTPCDAWTHMRKMSSIQFDPVIVEQFYEVLKDEGLLVDRSNSLLKSCESV